VPTGIANSGGNHSRLLPKTALGTPETTHGDNHRFKTLSKGSLDGLAGNKMLIVYRHFVTTTWQCLFGGW
jgi:hypothetical protein